MGFLERFMWLPECMVISDVCGKAKMDERGRVLIPLDEREKLGSKSRLE